MMGKPQTASYVTTGRGSLASGEHFLMTLCWATVRVNRKFGTIATIPQTCKPFLSNAFFPGTLWLRNHKKSDPERLVFRHSCDGSELLFASWKKNEFRSPLF